MPSSDDAGAAPRAPPASTCSGSALGMPRTMPPVRLRRRLFTAPTFSLGLPVADQRGGRLSNAAEGCAGSPWGSRGWGLPGRGPWRRRVLEGAGPLIACQHVPLLVHDPVPVEDRAARVPGEEPRPSFRDTRSSQGPPGVATSGAPSRRPRRSSPMIGRRWGPCGRWPRQLPDAQDGRLRAGCGAAPLRIAPVSSVSACGLGVRS